MVTDGRTDEPAAALTASTIADIAASAPHKTAVIHNGVDYSYARLAQWIDRCRRYLAAEGLGADDVAAIDSDDLLEAWVLLFALRGLGATTVAVPDQGQLGQLRLRRLSCVVASAAQGQKPGASTAPGGWRIVVVPAGLREASGDMAPGSSSEAAVRPGAHIMMTSATTGFHKKVVRDAVTEAKALPLHAEINDITAESLVYVVYFPLFTAGGYRWPLITWSVGGTVVIQQTRELHQPLIDYPLTHVFATPLVLESIIAAAGDAPIRRDEARLLVTGGALTRAQWDQARQRITPRVYSALASTEALTLGVTPIEQADDLQWHRIHPAREVQVVDARHLPLGPGQPGVVRVRIIDGLQGYLDDEAATRAFFRDGYFYPGDLGVLDGNGRLKLLGRSSDVINAGGNKFATGPIEKELQDRLRVEAVCMVSVPDPDGDEMVHLVVQSQRPLDQAEVAAAMREALGPLNQVPVRVVFVGKLPRNEMGKVRRIALRKALADALRQAKPGS